MVDVSDSVPVPCLGCGRSVMVPGGQVRAAMKADREYIVFCSKRCNVAYVATEGVKQQEAIIDARHSDANLGE